MVKRYTFRVVGNYGSSSAPTSPRLESVEDPKGEFVEWEDYEKLLRDFRSTMKVIKRLGSSTIKVLDIEKK